MILCRKPEETKSLGISRHKWKGDDTRALKEGACEIVDWLNLHQVNSGGSFGLRVSASSCRPVEIPVDWVCLPQVDRRILFWTGFICFLMWASGDSVGLGLSGPAETFGLCLSASCSGLVEIPVDWVYLPQVDRRRLLWTGFICFL
jgi:hypothetical protein